VFVVFSRGGRAIRGVRASILIVEAFFFALYFFGGVYAVIWNVGCCYAAADKVGLCNLRVGLLHAIVVMATAVRSKILGDGSCDAV
jgi:hypothetical protein